MSNGFACHLVGGTEQLQLSASSECYTTKLPGGAVSTVLFRGQMTLLAARRTQDGPKSGPTHDPGRTIDGRKKAHPQPRRSIWRGAQYRFPGDTVSPITVAASSRLRSTGSARTAADRPDRLFHSPTQRRSWLSSAASDPPDRDLIDELAGLSNLGARGGARPDEHLHQACASRIQAELNAIEREEAVRILFAVESGSRARGFP
jgi:RNA repair pathway DNA polymerase beta family